MAYLCAFVYMFLYTLLHILYTEKIIMHCASTRVSINLNAPMCSMKIQTYLTEMKYGDKYLTGVTNIIVCVATLKREKIRNFYLRK